MEPHVFLAVLAAAAMHATWNALLKLKLEPFLTMTLMTGMAGLAGMPAMAIFGAPILPAWPWLIASVILHLGYYFVLSAAYARADMSQIYPIARGGAPLATALISMLALREDISGAQLAGVALLASAVAALSIVGRRKGAPFDPKAVGFALATAAIICAYTLVDGVGARIAGDAHAYSSTLFVIDGIPLPLVALWLRGRAGLAPLKTYLVPGFIGGALSLGAYWIAIWAMTVAPIGLVAALRESSVLFAAIIAVVFLKEPLQAGRVLAALVILIGIAMIRLG